MNERKFLIKEISDFEMKSIHWNGASNNKCVITEDELVRRLDEITEAPYDQDPAIMYENIEILTTGGIGVKNG